MRILVIEDETDLLHVIAQALREQGYAIDEAQDGEEGLYKAQSHTYNAIVLDLMLPHIPGLEILKQLRQSGSKTPVLILTARGSIEDRVTGLDAGADDYLIKPFELDELFARIRSLIRRNHDTSQNTIHVDDFTIDINKHLVLLNDNPIDLTPREYAIFECLTLNRGKVISKEKLYDTLVDEFDDSLSNVIEVHISNLRKKLDKNIITTRRGMGYIID
ncbi:Transcriptional regulatory protein BasR [Poriferisphaera corsica]|uniref:Transcriptional regulatory protein BasR n=1 Tax=Poriferisphaera corsica TaxID=2528020 RepID=A0A517YX02_9BACT|nr:response regulator [Poriferisphaera corsica]QDU34768.1 Transcriptional regulatory protein BasR [Poriferisphaera corsica]